MSNIQQQEKPIIIAKILAPHSIKGDLKIIYFGDNIKNLETYDIFDKKNNPIKIKVINKNKIINKNEQIFIVKIDGIDDRNKAEILKGTELFTYRNNFKKLKKDEFYIHDLLDLKVFNMDKKHIGKVINLYDYSAGTIIEIEFLEDFIPNGYLKIATFPFKNIFFPQIDLEKSEITIDIPEMV
jgi:16S rRNA processing protein RimM